MRPTFGEIRGDESRAAPRFSTATEVLLAKWMVVGVMAVAVGSTRSKTSVQSTTALFSWSSMRSTALPRDLRCCSAARVESIVSAYCAEISVMSMRCCLPSINGSMSS